MQSEESVDFDLSEFYDILTSLNVKEKLKPFVRQFKKKNLPFIYQTMINIIQVFNSKKEMPLMKFNALMATKLFFDTGEYIPIILTQVYLLPIIFQVAVYRIQKRSQEGMTLYFIEKGYDSTKQMKRIGFNYVLLALEFLFMSAQVKPFRTLEKRQLNEKSSYAKYVKLLIQKGVQPIQTYKFYLPSYVNQSRKRYMKKLTKFNPVDYTEFFVRLVCQQLNLNKKPQIDLKKLLSYGDAFITIPIMNICEEQLDQMETNFINKKKYLNLLGDFMRAGDIYAVLIITRSIFLQQIYEKVKMVKGQLGLDAGEKIFPEVEASKADKRQFYVQYLKNVEIWASCHPADQEGDPTVAKKIFDILKKQRKFAFPPNILLNKIKSEMEANLNLNEKRNEQLLRLVDEGSAYQSRKKNSASMKESRGSKKSERANQSSFVGSYIEFDEVQQMVVKAKKNLNFIIQKEKLPQTIAFLQKYKRFWEAISQKNEIDADESGDIEIVLQQGSLCVKIVQMILPVYYLFNKQMITFEEYLDRVNLLMKTQEPQQEQGRISIEKGIAQPSIEQIQNIRQENEEIRSSYMSNKRESSLMQSKAKSKEANQIHQQRLEAEESKVSRESGLSKLKLNSFNDYLLPTHKNSFNQNYQNSNKMMSSKQNSESREENQNRTSSLRNSRNSKRILKRRSLKKRQPSELENSNEKQPTYRDIITKKDISNLKLNQKNYKQSFISSQNSSLKQNQHNRSNGSLSIDKKKSSRSSKLKKVQKISRNQENFKDSYFDDYYGDISKKEDILVHKLSHVSSNLNQKQSINKISQPKIESDSIESSILSKKSGIKLYNSGSFEILSSHLKDQQQSLTLRKQNKKKESKFTITSKDAYEIGSYDHLKDIPLLILSRFDKEDSIIQAPILDPLIHSFHELKEEQNTNLSKISTFKDCFDIKNDIISSKQATSRMFKYSKAGKIVNFVQTMNSRQTPKNSTIIDILSERNAKRSIQFYRNEKQKTRQAETLSERVKSLQSFNKNMRMKFVMRRQQQIPRIMENRSPKSTRQQIVQNDSEFVSFYPESQTSRQQSDTNLMLRLYRKATNKFQEEQKMRTINTNIYQSYFPQQISEKLKKGMLKSKGLLLKTQDFEIGSVVNQRQNSVQYALFLTPLKDKIEQVSITLSHDLNINTKLTKNYFQAIGQNQQQYINLRVSVENVPYVLPTLSVKFKSNRKYQHNQLLIIIPCSFNKFFTFNSVTQTFAQQFQSNNHDFIHIFPFKYSTKILNPGKLRQNFSNFSIISDQSRPVTYATEAYFKGKIFMLKFLINNKGTMEMQAKNMTGDHKNTKYLEFLMTTFRKILQTLQK